MLGSGGNETNVLVPVSALDHEQRRQLGALNLLAYPGFYGRFAISEAARLTLCTDVFDIRKGELDGARIALDGTVQGFFAALPSNDLRSALAATAFWVLKTAPRESRTQIMSVMEQVRHALPAVPADHYYLARLAVAPAHFGSGLAMMLMSAFAKEQKGAPAAVHVEVSNARGLAFYRKLGFVLAEQTEDYAMMTRV